MRTTCIAVLMILVGGLLSGCQGVNSYQAYTGQCTYRAADHGFCREPSNFYIADAFNRGRY